MPTAQTTGVATLALLLMLAACTRDELGEPTAGGGHANPIELFDASVGQRDSYVRVSLAAGASAAVPHADTLLVEVVAVAAGAITLAETLSPGSHAVYAEGSAVAFPHREFRYVVRADAGRLSVDAEGPWLDTRLLPGLADEARELSLLAGPDAADRQGDRVTADYLPVDRTLRLAGERVAVLHHAGRADGLPGFTFVVEPGRLPELALVEYGLAGEAEGWRRL